MSDSPHLIFEKPAQRHADLPVLIASRTGREGARIAEYLPTHSDKFREDIAGLIFG
jgi:hypothetical protein